MKKITVIAFAAVFSLGSIAPSWAGMGRDEDGIPGSGYGAGTNSYSSPSSGGGRQSQPDHVEANGFAAGVIASAASVGLMAMGYYGKDIVDFVNRHDVKSFNDLWEAHQAREAAKSKYQDRLPEGYWGGGSNGGGGDPPNSCEHC